MYTINDTAVGVRLRLEATYDPSLPREDDASTGYNATPDHSPAKRSVAREGSIPEKTGTDIPKTVCKAYKDPELKSSGVPRDHHYTENFVVYCVHHDVSVIVKSH